MFTKAIVRKPTPEIINGLTTSNLGPPDYELALVQHGKYVEALIKCGLEIMTLGPDSRYPDSTFIEDTAVVCKKFGLITRPGAVTRRGEILEVESVLHRFYKTVEFIIRPGALEGGDVMQVGDHFYIGISQRTNEEGADQLIRLAEKHGMSGEKVPLKSFLHLKSGLAYLDSSTLVITGEFKKSKIFDKYKTIKIPEAESYAANCLWINGTVLVAEGFPKTLKLIKAKGFKTEILDVSEFRKLDGGLSCLSLRLP